MPDRIVSEADEAALERESIALGINEWNKNQRKREEGGSPHTAHWSVLLQKQAIEPVSAEIYKWMYAAHSKPGPRHAALYLIEEFDPFYLAWIALRGAVHGACDGEALIAAAQKIGTTACHELTVQSLKDTAPALYNKTFALLADSPFSGNTARTKVQLLDLTKRVNPEGVVSWSADQKIQFGSVLIQCVVTATGLVQLGQRGKVSRKKSSMWYLETTQVLEDFIKRAGAKAEILKPFRFPMIVPPKDWTSPTSGGYLDQSLSPSLVKNASKSYLKQLAKCDMPKVYASINKHQRTPFKINLQVLEVAKQVWENGLELGGVPLNTTIPLPPRYPEGAPEEDIRAWKFRARKVWFKNRDNSSRRFGFLRALHVAERFSQYDQFWYPYQLDFRSRVYPIPSVLSPQGTDFEKGLLKFGRGKPIGEQGVVWLSYHLANTWGEDKLTLEQKLAWTTAHEAEILSYAADPLTNRGWSEADKPWQFLAACFEWAGYKAEGVSYVCSLRVDADGTCSGIQHFSAMSRDPVCGALVNLVPADRQNDIYKTVADNLNQLLQADLQVPEVAPKAQFWVSAGGVTRSNTKRPVMVLPYSATYKAFRAYLKESFEGTFRDLKEPDDGRPVVPPIEQYGDLLSYLTSSLVTCMDATLKGPTQIMDWLKTGAGLTAKAGSPISWTTPAGFLAVQNKFTYSKRRIRTVFREQIIWVTYAEATDKIDQAYARSGIVPNYVHSYDAAAVHNTAARDEVEQIASNHDSIGNIPADMPALCLTFLDEFATMYEREYPLLAMYEFFKKRVKEKDLKHLKPPPPQGTLDVSAIRNSRYAMN